MEELVEFLQVSLSKDFFFEDDFVVEQLQASMTELRRVKMELPAPGTSVARRTHTLTKLTCNPKRSTEGLRVQIIPG